MREANSVSWCCKYAEERLKSKGDQGKDYGKYLPPDNVFFSSPLFGKQSRLVLRIGNKRSKY